MQIYYLYVYIKVILNFVKSINYTYLLFIHAPWGVRINPPLPNKEWVFLSLLYYRFWLDASFVTLHGLPYSLWHHQGRIQIRSKKCIWIFLLKNILFFVFIYISNMYTLFPPNIWKYLLSKLPSTTYKHVDLYLPAYCQIHWAE